MLDLVRTSRVELASPVYKTGAKKPFRVCALVAVFKLWRTVNRKPRRKAFVFHFSNKQNALVRVKRFERSILSARDSKSRMYTNSITRAYKVPNQSFDCKNAANAVHFKHQPQMLHHTVCICVDFNY